MVDMDFWCGPTAVCFTSFVLQSTVNQVQWESTMITVPPAAYVCVCAAACMHAHRASGQFNSDSLEMIVRQIAVFRHASTEPWFHSQLGMA